MLWGRVCVITTFLRLGVSGDIHWPLGILKGKRRRMPGKKSNYVRGMCVSTTLARSIAVKRSWEVSIVSIELLRARLHHLLKW